MRNKCIFLQCIIHKRVLKSQYTKNSKSVQQDDTHLTMKPCRLIDMVTPSSPEDNDAGTHSIEKSFSGSALVTILAQQS
jgi:hypothetical protein